MKIIGIRYAVIWVVACTLLTSSCDVLDTKYYMGQSTKDLYSTANGVRSAAIGMYDAFQNSEFMGGRMQIYSDVRGVDVNPSAFFESFSNFNFTSSDGYIQSLWIAAYRTIYQCNLFIDNASKIRPSLMSDQEKNGYIAEGYFLRAVAYFYMINFWGQQYTPKGDLGIPLVLYSFDGSNVFGDKAAMPRATVKMVYSQIISDLLYAEANLPSTWKSNLMDRTRATKVAASAMLSRVYLYNKDYSKAVEKADKIIGAAGGERSLGLASDLKADCFSDNSNRMSSAEILFWLGMNSTDNPGGSFAMGMHYGASNRGDITVSTAYLNLFDAGDKRLALLTQKGDVTYCNKYPNGSQDWVPVIRYTEVLLNKAECLAQQSAAINSEALELVNLVRKRSGASVKVQSDFPTKGSFIDFILDERRRELAFEGCASYDLFRNGKGIPAGRGVSTAPAIDYPSTLFAAPIPFVDMQRNPNLVQNEGY